MSSTPPSAEMLLGWYDRHRRHLPWRAPPGVKPDPYTIWLSEIMLQQTGVVTVIPYFHEFCARWPTVFDLAAASLDEVLHGWQGLGYYSRARNMHACARHVAELLGGRFPDSVEGLSELPGIGPYTAAAIAAIAFDRPATVVDGNVERVMARIFAIDEPLPEVKPKLRQLAATLTPDLRPGDYAQAVMDLGATICVPRRPLCVLCPWLNECQARRRGDPETLPRRRAKARKPVRKGFIFWIEAPDGRVLLRRRAESGLLGGLMELPSTPWRETERTLAEALQEAPLPLTDPQPVFGSVIHIFTHFRLELEMVRAKADVSEVPDGVWVLPADFRLHALPTVIKKVVNHVLAEGRKAAPK